MSVRRVLTVLSLVGTLACWPAVGHAAASQPERRSTTSHSPTAAAAAVSVEADFDNDGFADLAVGVPREGVGTAELAGAVNILEGSANGLTGAGSQLLVQGGGGVPDTAEPSDFFGNALAAGDFNNDSFIDLAIGAPGEDLATIPDAGAVTVLYGSASGLAATGSQFFSQDTPGVLGAAEAEDGFGAALGVGDFNNDSFADLAIGVPSEGVGAASQAGAVTVLYGAVSGLTATGNQQWLQGSGGVGGVAEVGDQFGFALTSGDFNNDTFADLAVGAPFEDVGTTFDAGAINVLYGSAGRLAATGNQQWLQGSGGVIGVAEASDFFGAALAAGDFNNDTFADLGVGAPFEDVGTTLDAGAINVLYGSANRLTATGNQQWLQGSGGIIGVAEDGDIFGFALAAGDFNNNGSADLAIGVIGEDIGTITDAGSVNVLYGSANRLTATGNQQFFQGNGGLVGTAEEGDFAGAALSTGDYDNDTFADLAIGAPFEDIGTLLDAGAVNTLDGSAGTLTTTGAQQFFQGNGGVAGTPEEGDAFGSALA
jgi:hypothetical protein